MGVLREDIDNILKQDERIICRSKLQYKDAIIGRSYTFHAQSERKHQFAVAAQRIWLEFRTKDDMPDKGEKDGVSWETELDSVPVVGDMELPFRRVRVTLRGRSMVLYLPQ